LCRVEGILQSPFGGVASDTASSLRSMAKPQQADVFREAGPGSREDDAVYPSVVVLVVLRPNIRDAFGWVPSTR
jgi:hypothetical protein